jgi:CubicO group peptidase (beta-lactamase class C family)
MYDELVAYVQGTLETLRPCSAGIVVSVKGEVEFEAYLRGVEQRRPPRPVGPESLWAIFSTTKSFASAVLLNLAHEGTLALDDPISRFLPEFGLPGDGPFGRDQITFRHLASHTSGMELPEPRPAGCADLSAVRVVTQPGRAFNYSWLGMQVLELAMEKAAGQPIDAVFRERLTGPLSLNDTRFIYERDPGLIMLPCRDGSSGVADNIRLSERGHLVGGGLYSTPRDVNRFCQIWLNQGTFEGHTYFSPELQAEAWTLHGNRPSDNGRYGLLWWLFEGDGGYVASGASNTVSAVVPETGAVVTVIRNQAGKYGGRDSQGGPWSFIEDKRWLVRFGMGLG